ncbi:MAG: GNAT superfamily N-acetyltransferase [Gammaproteobacteria bacterium]|jgi:GNAT superfamily N-acetyltransferase
MRIRQATIDDLMVVAGLFDRYRQFYGQVSDIAAAQDFLFERFTHNQLVVFLVEGTSGEGLGFARLYPSYSSVSMAAVFILNDLYVAQQARRTGLASLLLERAANYEKTNGAIRLSLSTAHDNESAQALYVRDGWELDKQFCVFHKKL